MSEATDLINELFDGLRNLATSVDRCVDLFADDGAWELPYFPSIGIGSRFEGKKQVRAAFELIRSHFSSFTLSNIEIHEHKNKSGLFVEFHSEGFIDGTERLYSQDYVTRLEVENGKIKLLREYLNIIATARMLLPNGLASVPEPAKKADNR